LGYHSEAMSSESRGQLPVIDLGLLLGPNFSRQQPAASRSSHSRNADDDDETRTKLRGSDDETKSLKREKTGSDLRRHESSEQSKKNDEGQSSQLSRKQDPAGEGILSKTQLEETSRVSKRQKISFGDAWHSNSSDSEGEDDATSSKVSSRPQRAANERPYGVDDQGNVRLASDPKEYKREGTPPTVSGSRRETVESTNGASNDATSSSNDASKGQRRSIRNGKRKSRVFDEEEAPFCKTPQEGKFSETDVCLNNQIVMPPSNQQDLHHGTFRPGHGSNGEQQPAGAVTDSVVVTELSVQQQQQPTERPPSMQEVAAPEPSAASAGKAMDQNAAAAQNDGTQITRTVPRALIQQAVADFRSDYLLSQWYYSHYGMPWNSSGSQLNVFSPWHPSFPVTNPYQNVPFPSHHSGLMVNQSGQQWCPYCRRCFVDLSDHLSQSLYCQIHCKYTEIKMRNSDRQQERR
jgi:hypothetical protein